MLVLKSKQEEQHKVTSQWVLSQAEARLRRLQGSPAVPTLVAPSCGNWRVSLEPRSRTMPHRASASRKPAPGRSEEACTLWSGSPDLHVLIPCQHLLRAGDPSAEWSNSKTGSKRLPDISQHVCLPLRADNLLLMAQVSLEAAQIPSL